MTVESRKLFCGWVGDYHCRLAHGRSGTGQWAVDAGAECACGRASVLLAGDPAGADGYAAVAGLRAVVAGGDLVSAAAVGAFYGGGLAPEEQSQ